MNASLLNTLHTQYVTRSDFESTTSLHDAVRRYVAQMTRSHHLNDPENTTSDVVAQVWRSLPNFRGESSFATWVHRLSKGSIIDRIRSERRRPNLLSEDGEYGNAGTSSSSDVCMDVNDLHALTDSERELVCQLINTPDYDALAEQLGISAVALRNRFYRIKNKCESERYDSISAND